MRRTEVIGVPISIMHSPCLLIYTSNPRRLSLVVANPLATSIQRNGYGTVLEAQADNADRTIAWMGNASPKMAGTKKAAAAAITAKRTADLALERRAARAANRLRVEVPTSLTRPSAAAAHFRPGCKRSLPTCGRKPPTGTPTVPPASAPPPTCTGWRAPPPQLERDSPRTRQEPPEAHSKWHMRNMCGDR